MSNRPKVLSITEISYLIKTSLESRFQNINIQGEVTNYKVSSTGHHYFSLKDERACIQCVFFKNRNLSAKFPFKNGDKVVATGDVNVYEPNGTYQLIVKQLEPVGLGDLLAKIEALKQELHALGYFETTRKKPLPLFPKKIGIVTSTQGAVIQDMIHILNRRAHGYHLVIAPVKVQGDGAALEIKEAIELFNLDYAVDVIIVARGGGSIEDLMPYNDRQVAEAIYQSKIPIISAVGHEVDYTICDLVADVRAPTPSAAAEIVMPATIEIMRTLSSYKARLYQKMKDKLLTATKVIETKKRSFGKAQVMRFLSHLKLNVEYKSSTIDQTISYKLDSLKQALEDVKQRHQEKNPLLQHQKLKANLSKLPLQMAKILERDLLLKKANLKKISSSIDKRLVQLLGTKKDQLKTRQKLQYLEAAYKTLENRKEKILSFANQLSALNPKSILKKGYCIPFKQNSRSVILSSKELSENQPFDVLFHDGLVESQALKIQEHYESKLL